MSEGSLWDWAVQAYGTPGVSEACLDLQNTAGQNTCLLLWAAWTARTGRAADPDVIEAAVDITRAWDDLAVQPLRAVRRALKRPHPDLAQADRESVRDRVKAAELLAERRLLENLGALTPEANEAPSPALARLLAVSRVWAAAVPRVGLQTLAERLPA